MNVLDLFSGIGGFSLGLERAGMRTVAFCERDEFCRAVLRKHWPGVPIFRDIKHMGPAEVEAIGPIDLVCGGFPCQPFSHAGKQRAQADDRHLWPDMCKIIAYARPAWVIGENVAGLIPLALDEVLSDLEALGYAGRAFVIPAVAVDAPHRRDRVWIIACHADRDGESTRSVHAQVAELRRAPPDAESFGRRQGPQDGGGRGEGTGARAWTGPAGGCRWEPEPRVGRVAHGVPARVDRLRALGNAVVPQIPEIIGRAIMRHAHKSKGQQ